MLLYWDEVGAIIPYDFIEDPKNGWREQYLSFERVSQKELDALCQIGRGFLIAIGAAILTYTADTIPNVDFGVYTPMVMGIFSVLINFARKYLNKNTY